MTDISTAASSNGHDISVTHEASRFVPHTLSPLCTGQSMVVS